MWNSKKYATMAIVGAGLAVAAASPASACGLYGAAYGYGDYGCGYAGDYGYGAFGGYYGAVGYNGCGAYGYAAPVAYAYAPIAYGCGGYGAYGYASTAYGCGGYGAYGYAPITYGCGGYGAYGYAPAHYGYGYGFGCGRAGHHPRSNGYAVAYGRPYGYAVASYQLHRPYASAAYASRSSQHIDASAPSPRFAGAKHQNKIAYRANLKFSLAD